MNNTVESKKVGRFMEKDNIEYSYLIDDAKINLAKKIKDKMNQYQENPNSELKSEIINLMQDRQQLFLFNTDTIKKYL